MRVDGDEVGVHLRAPPAGLEPVDPLVDQLVAVGAATDPAGRALLAGCQGNVHCSVLYAKSTG